LQRKLTEEMLSEWDQKFPGRLETMFTAMQNVVPSHLADTDLFDFKSINSESGVIDGGDIAFDKEAFTNPTKIEETDDNEFYKQQPAVQFTQVN